MNPRTDLKIITTRDLNFLHSINVAGKVEDNTKNLLDYIALPSTDIRKMRVEIGIAEESIRSLKKSHLLQMRSGRIFLPKPNMKISKSA